MSKWEQITDEFAAESDDGQRFRMLVYQTFIDVCSRSNPNAPPAKGQKTLRTDEGYHVNRIDEDHFEIVGLGLRLKRVEDS